jgi:uncharacterized RDD family membrane protein YckC
MTTTTPATAAPPAPYGRRIAAGLVDGALTSVCAAPLWAGTLPAALAAVRGTPVPTVSPVLPLLGVLLLAGWGGVQWWCHGTQGWTVGRRLLGLRTVDVRTGHPIGLGRALGRSLVLALGSLVCAVGQLVVLASILLDPTRRGRGWHDRAADAVVVDVRGLPSARRLARMPVAAPAPPAPAPAPVPAPAPAPVPDEPPLTRWGALAAGQQLDAPGLVLPPVAPGLTSDTRVIPAVLDARPDVPPATGRHGAAPVEPPQPVWPTPPADVAGPGGPPAPLGWAVRLPDGTLLDLDSPVLVGRNPDPVPGARAVAVTDPGRSVSKTHLMVGRDADGPWVVDRGSTNGTLVTLPDGQRIVCLADRRVRLVEGSVIAFGDLSLTVGVRA